MIVLNFGPPISERQKTQIAASVAEQLDPRFKAIPDVQVLDVVTLDSARKTFNAVECNWNEAIAHRIPKENPIRDALLYEIERRCGYCHVEIRVKQ
jgi:hypothetical protein